MWGSIAMVTTSDPCTACPHLEACRRATTTRAPVRCELDHDPETRRAIPRGRPPKTWTHRDYAAHIRPGEAVTAADLAARAGGTMHNAGSWLSTQTKRGAMMRVGRVSPGPNNTAWALLYRLKEFTT
jgi:hypothetical protein